ncbi:MAG: excinuclease ABC subunit UvrB [Deltaproteobacteria bacterium]|nr:excinuclease ABC subunit UvrB [Deltaproteobacteria bacterium]
MKAFRVVSSYSPAGDQPKAIKELIHNLQSGAKYQTLMGITGSGKTYTIAKVLEHIQKAALILSPNKTLAAQLYNEFSQFFPEENVHFFISYYDYYRPEAYIPETDTYLEKDALINQDIDALRHAATISLLEDKQAIVIASVSAIYGIGAPEEYLAQRLEIRLGGEIAREDLCFNLANRLLYKREFENLTRGTFRLTGDTLEIIPSHETEKAFRIIFLGDQVEEIHLIDALTKKTVKQVDRAVIYPASHFTTAEPNLKRAIQSIRQELEEQLNYFRSIGKVIEAERLESRTLYDLALLSENGTCPGIENYSRHLAGRKAGEPPVTLIDYFPKDYIMIIDESHVTIPQLRGMYEGDRSRKQTLVDFGFRLPSALDNRPLKFDEVLARINQCIFVSATPGPFELEVSRKCVVELINRPTGITDPVIEIRPASGQVKDCLEESVNEIKKGGKVLVMTITKKIAEELAVYFRERNVRARYIHSELNAIERYDLLRALRSDLIDVLIGVNLLREGLDLVEVSLVCILDADKEGFLRSSRSLIQIIGRAARNISGRAILYADKITESIKIAVEETNRRRKIQLDYNRRNKIKPYQPKPAPLQNFFLEISRQADTSIALAETEIKGLEEEMYKLAKEQKFEEALQIREKLKALKKLRIMLSDEKVVEEGADPDS